MIWHVQQNALWCRCLDLAIYWLIHFKLWIVRKYAIELIPVKSYEKGLGFCVAKTLRDIRNNSLKLAKVFSQLAILFKDTLKAFDDFKIK